MHGTLWLRRYRGFSVEVRRYAQTPAGQNIAFIVEHYDEDPLDVMEWSKYKRRFYAEFLQTHYAQQQQATGAANGDLDGLVGAADQQAAGHGHATASGGHAGRPSAGNLPDDVDPANVPTPDGVDNPHAPTAHGSGGNGTAVDGNRITRRDDAADDTQEQHAQFDPQSVHPAVRGHSNVVKVRGDGHAPGVGDGDADAAESDANEAEN